MHRSGTSAVTRGLKVVGVELGTHLMSAADDNSKGFWEDLDLNALNVEMLQAVNSDWHHLASITQYDVDTLCSSGYFERAISLISEKTCNLPIYGFKDPRVAKLLPFWSKVFSHCQLDPNYVLAIRNPINVANSLARRNSFGTTKSYFLWLGHIIESLKGSQGAKRMLVDYDLLINSPEKEIHRIASTFGLRVDDSELKNYCDSFLDSDMRHHAQKLEDLILDTDCPPLAKEIYTLLLNVASGKTQIEDSILQKKVDSWVVDFDRMKNLLIYADQLEAKVTQAAQAINERDARIAGLNEAVAERDARIQAITTSHSWLITKPLRWLGRILRRGA